MKKSQEEPTDAAELRRRAEDLLEGRRSKATGQEAQADTVRPIHELEVHQIELEMQNDELRRTSVSMAALAAKYTDLYDFAPSGYLNLGREGTISQVNLTGAKLLAVERGKLMGRNFARLVADMDRDRWHRMSRSLTEQNDRQVDEFVLQRGDGTAFAAQLDCLLVTSDDEPAAVRISFTDITERKQAVTTLREREARYRAIVETSMDGFWVLDTNGRILEVNDRYVQRSGYSREELLGLSLFDIDAMLTHAEISAAASQTGNWIGETWHRAKDGSIWPVEVSSIYLPRESGCRYTFLRDITGRKRVEKQLKLGSEKLAAAMLQLTVVEEQERRAIATDLHDDLSQLLAAAKIRMRILAKQDGFAEYQQALQEIVELVEQADQSARSLSYQISPPMLFDLGLVPALQSLAEELHKVHRLTAIVHDDGRQQDLSPTTRSVLYRATRELLINVAKHAKVDVADVDVRTADGLLIISVTDSGVGFDRQLIEKHASVPGFGLVSMRERLRLIGGQFEIDTHPGDGTVATLIMPLEAPAGR